MAEQAVKHEFRVPERMVKNPEDMEKWPTSQVDGLRNH